MFDLPWGDLIPFVFFGVVVADASVAIRGDMSGFHRDLKGAETATVGLGAKLRQIFSPQNLAMGAGVLGIGLGVRNLVSSAGDAAEAFSELQQTQRTANQVFGDSIGVLDEWAQKSAEAAGMSQQAVYQSGALIGSTLRNMGFEIEEAVEWTVRLQRRAAEMAVAFGQTPERAILAITAAIRGERDTIEKFGVSIKQAQVNAEVAANGWDTSTAAAKANADAMAILNLVMEQTAGLSGRFASGQDDIAVSMARVKAQIADFEATQLGPAVASIQLGAIKVAEATGSYFETAGNNIDTFALNFGSQRAQIAQTADQLGMDFVTLKDRVVALMADGMGFEMALEVAADPQAAHDAGIIMLGGVGDAIAQGAAEFVDPAVEQMMRGAGDMIAGSAPVIEDASEIIAKIPETWIKGRYDAIRSVGAQTVIEYAKGLLTPQNDVEIAIQAALQIIEDEMSITEELAYLSGQKTVLQNARGIASAEGKQASVLAIDAALAEIESRMALLANRAYDYGFNTSTSYAAGLLAGKGIVVDAAHQIAQGVAAPITINSEPPDHSSALYGITKWGGNIVKTIAGGIYGELGTGSAASAALAGALVPVFGGVSAATSLPAASRPVGGNSYHIHLEDRLERKSVQDLGAELRRLGEMGLLPGSLNDGN